MTHRELLTDNKAGIPVPDCDGAMIARPRPVPHRGRTYRSMVCDVCGSTVLVALKDPTARPLPSPPTSRLLRDLARSFELPGPDKSRKGL